MPLWPFGRKEPRLNSPAPVAESEKIEEKRQIPGSPRYTVPAPLTTPDADSALTRDSSQRKRRRSVEAEQQRQDLPIDQSMGSAGEKAQQAPPPARSSVEDITALPGVKELERSPHLRPANMHHPVIPYNLNSSSAARKLQTESTPSPQRTGKLQKTRSPSTKQRPRPSRQAQALREEEIRAMSAPVDIPKQVVGHGELLRRDSKKARRTFNKASGSDTRGSKVALPFEDAIHSAMSGVTDKRAWEVSGFGVLNPRPTVRLSGADFYKQRGGHTESLSRNGSKRERMPAVHGKVSEQDRRKIADLADELDASDLRVLMERDNRRRDQQREADQARLERKLRRKAEKQRAEEEARVPPVPALLPPPALAELPTAVHPAFRDHRREVSDPFAFGGMEPMTPLSTKHETPEDDGHANDGTYLRYAPEHIVPEDPFQDPETSVFADPVAVPEPVSPIMDPILEHEPVNRVVSPLHTPLASPKRSPLATPVETPMEDPILEIAQAVRLSMSQGRMSPSTSPIQIAHLERNLSPLRREYTPEILPASLPLDERRASDASTKRSGTWAQLFRRGGNSSTKLVTSEPAPLSATSDASFSNTSRESMSRQPIPAHLVQAVPHRRSGVPARTQSRFREDLPELPASPPDSRVQSPDIAIAAAQAAAARRGKHSTSNSNASSNFFNLREPDAEASALGRTDSPVDVEQQAAMSAGAGSLGTIGSEGSWLTGRPSKRVGRDSQIRSSSGSSVMKSRDFSGSFEDLGMPDDQYFQRMTSGAHTLVSDEGRYSEIDDSEELDPNLLTRHDTARRQPTVVHHEARAVSREGLLSQYQAGEAPIMDTNSAASVAGSMDDEFPDRAESRADQAYIHHAHSVNYGKRHAKQHSAGSAKLLDIPPSRTRSRRDSPETRSPNLSSAALT